MRCRDIVTDEVFTVLSFAQLESAPNPDAEGEFLIDVISPAGEEVQMSVHPDADFKVLTNDEGYRMVHPNWPTENFEVIENG